MSQLKIAWHTRVAIPTKGKPNFTGAFSEAEPVVYGGTMYMPDTKGNVFAFDAVTGERLWFYKPKYPKGFSSGLPTSRGVVIGDGKVFMAQTDGNIVGLDQSTGRVVWKTNAGDYKQGYFFTSPPTYYNGTLVIGQSGGDFGARCKVLGLDAKTGKIKWHFNVIPVGKELGSDTWPKKRAYLGGGAVWAPLTVDPALGLVYIGVGNPVPYNGVQRGKGKELFTESVVALNASTGKYRWHYQEVHHDIWDYDTAANPLVLFDLTIKGTPAEGAREHGQDRLGLHPRPPERQAHPRHPGEEGAADAAQHTYPTQPIPNGDPFAAQCADQKVWSKWKAPDGKPVKVGCIFTPYDDKSVHGVRADRPRRHRLAAVELQLEDGLHVHLLEGQLGRVEGPTSGEGGPALKPLGNFFQIEGLFPPKGSPGLKPVGRVVAMNMRTNSACGRSRSRRVTCATAASCRPPAASCSSAGTTAACRPTTTTDRQAPLVLAEAARQRRCAADDLHGQRQAVRRGLRGRERHLGRFRNGQGQVRLGSVHVRAPVLAAGRDREECEGGAAGPLGLPPAKRERLSRTASVQTYAYVKFRLHVQEGLDFMKLSHRSPGRRGRHRCRRFSRRSARRRRPPQCDQTVTVTMNDFHFSSSPVTKYKHSVNYTFKVVNKGAAAPQLRHPEASRPRRSSRPERPPTFTGHLQEGREVTSSSATSRATPSSAWRVC